MTLRLFSIAFIALACGGCWDFVEPDFPEAGAPVVITVNVFANEAGEVQISGLLAPGLTTAGLQRRVLNDTLIVYGIRLSPAEVRRNGSREYRLTDTIDNVLTRPLEIEVPRVEGVTRPPSVRWFGVRKLDPDTISYSRNTDLVLRIDTTLAPPVPTPQIRQWFLDLRGSARSFRVSSDGLPPANLRIPSEWVPASDSGTVVAVLTFFQAGTQLSTPRDYLNHITLNTVLRWTIKVIP